MPINRYEDRILWVDIETTGLELARDLLLEVTLAVTDLNLEIHTYHTVVFPFSLEQTKLFKNIDQIVLDMHTENGLWIECAAAWDDYIALNYSNRIQYRNHIYNEIINFIEENAFGSIMAGNSIHFDRSFLNRELNHWFNPPNVHYRVLDVSSLKETFKKWIPLKWTRPTSQNRHRGFSDIEDSIKEFRFYLEELGWQEEFEK